MLYLAEGDNVRLGCPYILDPEDYGPSGLDIEWMQVNSDPSHRENVVSAGHSAPLTLLHGVYLVGSQHSEGRRANKETKTLNFPKASRGTEQ